MAERKPTDAIRTYLEHLHDDEFEQAANQFTEDVSYYHPPTHENVSEVEGRENLYEYFADVRGPREHEHEITNEVNEGNRGGVLGHVTGGDEDGNVFVAYAETEGDEISHYVAGINPKDL